MSMALSFFKKSATKKFYVFNGIILAIVLHSLFNFFIINSNGEQILTVFAFVWMGIILLLLSFERIKKIKLNRIDNIHG